MGIISKCISLLLMVILAVSSLLIVQFVSAQSITKPSVPEFTVEQYQIENTSTVVKIKNQPFTPYLVNGSQVNLYYQIRDKGHLEGEEAWDVQYGAWNSHGTAKEYPKQSDSEYTLLSLQLDTTSSQGFDNGGKWDIQVQAMVGNIYLADFYGVTYRAFDGEKSDWSNTQTITIPTAAASASPIPTPTVPELLWLVIFLLFTFVSLLLYRWHRKPSLSN